MECTYSTDECRPDLIMEGDDDDDDDDDDKDDDIPVDDGVYIHRV